MNDSGKIYSEALVGMLKEKLSGSLMPFLFEPANFETMERMSIYLRKAIDSVLSTISLPSQPVVSLYSGSDGTTIYGNISFPYHELMFSIGDESPHEPEQKDPSPPKRTIRVGVSELI
jgi:hypothetical protein